MTSTDAKLKKQQRPFLVGVGLFLIGLGMWKALKTPAQINPALFGTGAFFCAIDMLIPPVASLIFRVWMAFAQILGTVNTWILVSLVYFLLITPISLLMRVFKKPGPNSVKAWREKKSSWTSLEAEWKQRNYFAPY